MRRTDCRVGKPLDAGVLYVLRNGEQASLDDERSQPATGLFLAEPEVFGDRRAESAAADDDDVERPAASAFPGVDLGDVIAEVSALESL